MKREYFKQLLNEYKEIQEYTFNLERSTGLDLFESDYPIMLNVDRMFELTLQSHYNKDQVELIFEYIYDNDWEEETDMSEFISLCGSDFTDGRIGDLDSLYNLLLEL